jgi:hypothetical protein
MSANNNSHVVASYGGNQARAGKTVLVVCAAILSGAGGYYFGARSSASPSTPADKTPPTAPRTENTAAPVPLAAPVNSPVISSVVTPVEITPTPAGEPAIAAVVNDKPITLRAIEDALLKKEGVAQVLDMLDRQYSVMDWSALQDRDVIVQTATWRLTRLSLGAQLLKAHASDAREDLIGIALVTQALEKNNIVIDEAAIQNEVKRMEKRHYDALEARKQPYMEFKQFIEQTQKIPFENYIHQEGFKMGVGIRILVERATRQELTDNDLHKYLAANEDRYLVQEAADLSAIYIPYQTNKTDGGKDVVTEDEKIRVYGVMQQLYDAIMKRQVSFERTFQTFGKVYDAHADAQGRLGFVNRDGTRMQKGSRRVDPKAMNEAFAVQPPYPQLLKPVVGDSGIELLMVHSRRAGKAPVFADLRERIMSDIVDSELPARTKKLLDSLRRSSVIDYRSLPPLLDQRARAAGLPTTTAPEVEP